MGVRDLYKVLQTHTSQPVIIPLSRLYGKILAVDVSIYLYRSVLGAGDQWLYRFMGVLCELKRHGIKAVCIFDGKHQPVEKLEEQKRRREQGAKSRERKDACIAMKAKLEKDHMFRMTTSKKGKEKGPKPLTPEIVEECQRLIGKPRQMKIKKGKREENDSGDELESEVYITNDVDYESPEDIIEALRNLIDRLEKQTAPINQEVKDTAYEIVDILGLMRIEAHGEAEALCSYLTVHGKVDATLSADTDVLAYGTPLFLSFRELDIFGGQVYATFLPTVLDEMGLTYREFLDLTILLKNDYNHRCKAVPPNSKTGKFLAIGMAKAVELIREYRSIDAFVDRIEDPEVLNYKRCRELFTVPETLDLEIVYNKPIDIPRLKEFIPKHGLSHHLSYYEKIWKEPQLLLDLNEAFDASVDETSTTDEN